MTDVLKAVRYRNLDEARRVLRETVKHDSAVNLLDDGGEEPQGLLAVVPEDRLPEEEFYRLLEAKLGTLVEVERIPYSGYGPPSEETDYMGYVSEHVAYVLKGSRLPIEIEACPQGALDIHHLEALVLDGLHPLDRENVARRLNLPVDWDFEELFDLILEGRYTAQEIDRLIHQDIQ